MTYIPNVEHVILQINRCFSGTMLKPSELRRFNYRNLSLEKQRRLFEKSLGKIFLHLELDDEAQSDIFLNVQNAYQAFRSIECQTLTFNASQKQILWEHLAHLYVPGLARLAANWTLDANHEEISYDVGMPLGKFWYLPESNIDESRELSLPVPQVLEWLQDISGGSLEVISKTIDDHHTTKFDNPRDQHVLRNFHRWANGEHLPDAKTISSYFSDDLQIEFDGAYENSKEEAPEEELANVLGFLKSKFEQSDNLVKEIAMQVSPENSQEVQLLLDGNAPRGFAEYFVEQVKRRYQAPRPRDIRQRLLFARAMQDGYLRLQNFLTPNVSPKLNDPRENRIIELMELFKLVYNLTIDANRKCKHAGLSAENQHFRKHLPFNFADGLFASVAPRNYLSGASDHEIVSERLSYIFYSIADEETLSQYLPFPNQDPIQSVKKEIGLQKECYTEILKFADMLMASTAKPISLIDGCTNPWTLRKIVCIEDLNPTVRKEAADKLCIEFTNTSLGFFGPFGKASISFEERDKKSTEYWLDKCSKHEYEKVWRPYWLKLKARHLVDSKNFPEAKKFYRDAWKASKEKSCGTIRGQIAQELLSIEMKGGKYNKKNHPPLIKDIEYYDVGNTGPHAHQRFSRLVGEWFWEELYNPYPDLSYVS